MGFVPFVVDTIIATNSRKLAIHGILTVVYVLFPFAEEPWLREQYGGTHAEYCEQTPRFFSRESLEEFLRS